MQPVFDTFSPISLDDLNSKAAMLDRIDQKYVVSGAELADVLPTLAEHFDVLEIKGQRSFTYSTRYFDSLDSDGYFDHHNGKRKRFKVRVRNYVDAGISFVEVKLKAARGQTIKKRLPISSGRVDRLDGALRTHISSVINDHYDDPFDTEMKAEPELEPAIDMTYVRTTLVAREGGERMTIDGSLRFNRDGADSSVAPDRFIVETKSLNGRGIADAILRRANVKTVKSCSKYCVAMATLAPVERRNRFLPAMRRLGLID
ncbi:MAG: VTC domain-containing protein [Boseongicola sp.]|nr:MAG: VTC domain-containing protein [Boseongicola sp.]